METCKEKMESQSKLMSEYATRLEEYDRRFKKLEMLGLVFTDLNKDNVDVSVGSREVILL